jgi:hypothetical protein
METVGVTVGGDAGDLCRSTLGLQLQMQVLTVLRVEKVYVALLQRDHQTHVAWDVEPG